ncbi:hypothetical protein D3C73_1075590 [compost metagenome]
MVLPTIVPPSALRSIGLFTTLTSDSFSRRFGRSFVFLVAFFTACAAFVAAGVGPANTWFPVAFLAPSGETVLLWSVGIWASPREVICLRLLLPRSGQGFNFTRFGPKTRVEIRFLGHMRMQIA